MAHYLALDQHGHIHEHVMQFPNRVLQFNNISMTCFDISKSLFGLMRIHNNALRENGRVALFQHLLQFFIRSGSASCKWNKEIDSSSYLSSKEAASQ